MMVIMLGPSLVNPMDDCRLEVAITSATIAIAKYNHVIKVSQKNFAYYKVKPIWSNPPSPLAILLPH